MLFVLGMCEFIYVLRMLLYYPKVKMCNYLIVTLKKDFAVNQLDYLWQKIKWHGDSFANGIIAVIDDLENHEVLACNNYAKNKNISICFKSDLSQCSLLS